MAYAANDCHHLLTSQTERHSVVWRRQRCRASDARKKGRFECPRFSGRYDLLMQTDTGEGAKECDPCWHTDTCSHWEKFSACFCTAPELVHGAAMVTIAAVVVVASHIVALSCISIPLVCVRRIPASQFSREVRSTNHRVRFSCSPFWPKSVLSDPAEKVTLSTVFGLPMRWQLRLSFLDLNSAKKGRNAATLENA